MWNGTNSLCASTRANSLSSGNVPTEQEIEECGDLWAVTLEGSSLTQEPRGRFQLNPEPRDAYQHRMAKARRLPILLSVILTLGFVVPWVAAEVEFDTVARSGDAVPDAGDDSTFDVGTFRSRLINNRGDILFLADLSGREVDESNDSGLFLATESGVALLVREGNSAPGFDDGAVFKDLTSSTATRGGLALNDRGRFTFVAEITGGGLQYPSNLGIWTGTSADDLRLVVQGGDLAPDTLDGYSVGDATFGRTSSQVRATGFARTRLRLGPQDDYLIWAFLSGPRALRYPTNDGWNGTCAVLRGSISERTSVEEVVSVGQPVMAVDETVGILNVALFKMCLNSNGLALVQGTITQDGRVGWEIFPTGNAYWLNSPGQTLVPIVATGFSAPGLDGVRIGRDRPLEQGLNDRGEFVFLTGLQGPGVSQENDEAIWFGTSEGHISLFLREDEPAPGVSDGARLGSRNPESGSRTIGETLAINRRSSIVVLGRLRGERVTEGNDLGLWLGPSREELNLVARTGTTAPGTRDGVVFSNITSPQANARGQLVFQGRLAGVGVERNVNDIGFWVYDPELGLRLVIREGDSVSLRPGDTRTISGLARFSSETSGGEDGRQRVFSDRGEFAVSALFADGSAGLIRISVGETPVGDTVVPGDCNSDGRLDIADAACALLVVFRELSGPCDDSQGAAGGRSILLDFDGDGAVELDDGIGILRYLFLEASPHVLGTECLRLDACLGSCQS